jgi:hypothetical protein
MNMINGNRRRPPTHNGWREGMKWYPFDKAKGYRQKRPPEKKYVLVQCVAEDECSAPAVAVGYRKNAAGCKDSPYFVIPGVGGEVIAWCDCLPSDFDTPLWNATRPRR